MADPLSIAGSIAGLVSLADVVFLRAFRYVQEVRSAEKSVTELVKLLQMMCGTLHMLGQRTQVLVHTSDPRHLRSLPPILEDCEHLLEDIKAKLDKYQKPSKPTTGAKIAASLKKLQWPYDMSSTNQLIDKLTKFNAVIMTALEVNTMLDVQKVLERAGQLSEDIKQLERSFSMKMNQLMMIELDKEQSEAIQYFQKADPSERHKIASKLWQRGTGKWFTDSDDFTSWFDGTTPKVWLSGIPGAGKTILASAIIAKAKRQCEASGGDVIPAYFYCDYKDSKTHEIDNILGSIAAQIAMYNQEALSILLKYYKKFCKPGRPPTNDNQPDLITLIHEMSNHFDRVVLVIDGLDECGTEVYEVSKELDKLAGLSASKTSLLLLSRDEYEVKTALASNFVLISIVANTVDLKLYVYAQVDRRTADGRLIIDDTQIKDQIMEKLVNKANGMFRWVACQIDYLCDLPNDLEREAALDDLPPDIFSSYDRILQRVMTKGRAVQTLVQRTLRWTVHAKSPLNIDSLREALAIEVGDKTLMKSKMTSEKFILRHCSSLVRRSVDGRYIEPAHFTVKEYLEKIAESGSALSQFRTQLTASYQYMASISLTHLNFLEFSDKVKVEAMGIDYAQADFHFHAVNFWHVYARETCNDATVFSLAQRLFQAEVSVNFLTWLHQCASKWYRIRTSGWYQTRKDKDWPRIVKDITPLHCAAFLRLPYLITWLINQGLQVNTEGFVNPPLVCALINVEGYEHTFATVTALLDAGADASKTTYGLRSGKEVPASILYPLLASKAIPDDLVDSLVKVLLKHGAKLDRLTGERWLLLHGPHTARRLACFTALDVEGEYYPDFLDKLRRHGIFQNPMKSTHGTSSSVHASLADSSLRYSVRFGQVSAVQSLLTASELDLNSTDEAGETSLHIAARQNDGSMTALLLRHGASINKQNKLGLTPLHICVKYDSLAAASVLLTYGARTDIKDSLLKANIWVSSTRNSKMLKLLIDHHKDDGDFIFQAITSTDGPLFHKRSHLTAEIMNLLLAVNIDYIQVCNNDGQNLAHLTATFGIDVLEVLVTNKVDLTLQDTSGQTCLHILAGSGMSPVPIDKARLLIKNGAKPETLTLTKDTAAHVLLSNALLLEGLPIEVQDKIDLISLLLNKATGQSLNMDGLTPLDLFMKCRRYSEHFWLMLDHVIAEQCAHMRRAELFNRIIDGVLEQTYLSFAPGAASTLAKLLLERASETGEIASSLHGAKVAIWAVRNIMPQLFLSLVRCGADLTRRVESLGNECILQNLMWYNCELPISQEVIKLCTSKDILQRYGRGLSLLHLLCGRSSASDANLVTALVEAGAAVDCTTDEGCTPAMLAAAAGRLDRLQLLLENGASLSRRDSYGWNVLHHARLSTAVVQYLFANHFTELNWHDPISIPMPSTSNGSLVLQGCSFIHLISMVHHDVLDIVFTFIPGLDVNVRTTTAETPLHLAAAFGFTQNLEILLSNGANLEAQDHHGATALHIVCKKPETASVELLLRRNANINAIDSRGDTPLHYSVANFHRDNINLLLVAGAQLLRDTHGFTPELLARSCGRADIAELFSKHVEHPAVAQPVLPGNKEDRILKRSKSEGSRDRAFKQNVFLPLIIAIENDDRTIVEALIGIDAHKDSMTCSGCSPVRVAVECQKWDIVDLLIKAGYSTLSWSCSRSRFRDSGTVDVAVLLSVPLLTLRNLLSCLDTEDLLTLSAPRALHLAAMTGNLCALSTLLERQPQSYIERVVKFSHPSFHALVERGRSYNWNWLDEPGTALHVAVAMTNVEAVKLLLEFGADVNNATKTDVMGVLHINALTGSIEMATTLLNESINVNSRSSYGCTPILMAAANGHAPFVQLLLERGAHWDMDDLQTCLQTNYLYFTSISSLLLAQPVSSTLLQNSLSLYQSIWDGARAHLLFFASKALPDGFSLPPDCLSRHLSILGEYRLKKVLKWLKTNDLLQSQIRFASPSPLCVAVQLGKIGIVDALLRAGASLDTIGCDLGTALTLACALGRFEIVKYLVQYGATLTHDCLVNLYDHPALGSASSNQMQRWLLVDRHIDQHRITERPLEGSENYQTIKPWSGLKRVTFPLFVELRQLHGESLMAWQDRKMKTLKHFEGRILHYGPGTKYAFVTDA